MASYYKGAPVDQTTGLTAQDMGAFGQWSQGMGALMGAVGALAQGEMQGDAARYSAEMARINAGIAETNARTTLMLGQRDEQRVLLAGANMKASQAAAQAANGIDLGVGSAAAVRTSTDVLTRIDANTVAANAIRQAWGYRMQAAGAEGQAMLADTRAGQMQTAGALAATSSLLTGAGTVASSWYRLRSGSGIGTAG